MLEISDDDLLLMQPTRVVAEGNRGAFALVRELNDLQPKLVIAHSAGDEGQAYASHIRRYAALLDVKVIFASEGIADQRGTAPDGSQLFTMADAYGHADWSLTFRTTKGSAMRSLRRFTTSDRSSATAIQYTKPPSILAVVVFP